MSPLKTITFEELRERNENALTRVNYTPEGDFSILTAYQRRRVQQLLTDRAHLEDLASTQSQREAYGVEQWHNQFVRLRDTETHPDSTLEGDELRQRIWDAVPNSRFRRFQEAFCHPHQFIAPPFKIHEGNRVEFTGNPDFNVLSLAPCLVSTDRIPEKLAEDLGLVELEESDRSHPYERLKKKAELQAIARLKKIWESAVPLQRRHHRILAIQQSTTTVNARYPSVAGPGEELAGTILYTREEENGREQARAATEPPRQLSVQHFRSVYSAHRKTFHEAKAYNREIDQLGKLQEELQLLNTQIDREWKKETPEEDKDRMLAEARTLVARGHKLLADCENKYKVRADDLLAGLTELGPEKHKQRISASLSKMVAVINRLQSRFEEMYPKGGYNEQDQMVLGTHITRNERCMRQFRGHVQQNAPVLDNGLALFGGKPLTEPQVETQTTGVLRRMHIHPDDLNGVQLRPFTVYAHRLREKRSALGSALRARNQHGAKDAVVQMHVIGKFQEVRTCFEQIKQYVIDGEHIPIARIRDFVHHMNGLFSTFQVFPDHIVAGYEGPFTHMRDELERIEQGLAYYADRDVDVGTRAEIYKSLKQYIEQFDIEEMATALS
ncbi:hypothetical protein COU79_04715 [Candidatus Peregrinibacteria bacterium CG10_big_fil_rev_8_21_14_0_10_54_7]|nr:MAG: hypothetical protein COU79_04715 [Candidatus Peregrinibacteria bacterium CG10_big_fil_rev_8_21_14_0_10_54_7]